MCHIFKNEEFEEIGKENPCIKVEKLAGILIHILLIASARIPIRMILSKKEDSLAHKIQEEKKKNKLLEGWGCDGFQEQLETASSVWMVMAIYG